MERMEQRIRGKFVTMRKDMGKKKPAVRVDWLASAEHDPTPNLFAQREQAARSSPIITDPKARRSLKPGLHQPAKKPPASEDGFLSAPVESAFPDSNLAQRPELTAVLPEISRPAPFAPSPKNERARPQTQKRNLDIPAKFEEIVRRAAKDAGHGRGSVRKFCEFLDRDPVPTPRTWGVKTWMLAYADRKRQSAIRGIKLRHSQPA
jgi:hypothetical protein